MPTGRDVPGKGVQMIVSLVGPLGLSSALEYMMENKGALEERFAPFFLKQLKAIEMADRPYGNFLVKEIRKGGLYGALWEAASELGCGLEIDELKIPVRQEVIEILELADESPYEVPSVGCFLVISREEVRNAAVIGRTSEEKARVINTEDGVRYLTPPERQDKDIKDRKSYC